LRYRWPLRGRGKVWSIPSKIFDPVEARSRQPNRQVASAVWGDSEVQTAKADASPDPAF